MKKIILFILSMGLFSSCTNHQFLSEIRLLSDSTNNSSSVFLTNDERGNPAISWTEIDSSGGKHFYCAFWDTQTLQFKNKINIPIPQNTSIHEEGMPKIVFNGDRTIVATFETSVPEQGSRWGKGDIEYSISSDRGKTWTKPISVQAGYSFEGSIGFSNTKRLDDGQVGIVWLGTNAKPDMGRPVMFAKTINGRTFTKPILIDSVACECCRIAIGTNGDGGVNIVFRNLLPGSVRDISIAGSNDNGQTFSRPVSFSDDHWVIDGCPHNGPSVVCNTKKTYAAWYSGTSVHENAGVYYASIDKNNNLLTKRLVSPAGKFIQLCLMPDGTRIIGYDESNQEGDSIYNKILIGKINGKEILVKEMTQPRSHGFYPMVAPVGNNHVVIAWKDENRIFYRSVAISEITTKIPERKIGLPDMKKFRIDTH